jgi:two-component system OmpR family response regulator
MSGRPASVLVVDDDVAVAGAFAKALRLDGYQVKIAHSAESALRELQQETPDAIILDFRMPFINGTGFLYRLRAQDAHRHVPVMIVTGEPRLSEENKAEFKELGASVRIKPVGLKDLLDATRMMLLTSNVEVAIPHV